MNLLNNCAVDWVLILDAAASSTDANSAILDMQGYEGVMFIVPMSDSAATGVATLNVQGNSANSDSGMATITGAVATATCSTNDDLNGTLLVVDVYKPLERYIQGNITSGTANIAYDAMVAIRYKGHKAPVTQDTATVSASTSVVGS